MSAADNKAVFLSYASQDAAAAKRVCDALRGAGIEVWFDQSELRGGDSWDQKIRKQIKECTLFLPIVSANTQARREGYFRLEWKLAEDRTHLMAKGTPFLVPVCIDDTKDWDALVPDSFMTVQWSRLSGGETPPKFVERVGQLLRGDTTPPLPGRAPAERAGSAAPPSPPPRHGYRWLGNVAAIAGILMGLIYAFRPAEWRKPRAEKTVPPAAAAPVGVPRDPELNRAVALLNGNEANSEDFALAEEIARKALAKNSTDPEAVTVMARVQVAYLLRGFDRGDERRAAARRYAERAVQLAPNAPDALAALGVFHFRGGNNPELARELLNKAIQLRPEEPYFHRHRDNALFSDPRVTEAEAIAAAERTAERFPRDALTHYELARHYRDLGRIEESERAIDRALAIEPIANAIVWKARIALNIRGDLVEMKALIDRVPPRMRSLERVVLSRWIYAMAATDREDGMEALRSLTNPWIEDFYYVGPKSLLLAVLLEASSRREAARLHYEAALREIRDRKALSPASLPLRNLETCALLGLGQMEEARAVHRVVIESVRRPYRYDPFELWWFNSIPRCLLVGDRETALQLLGEAARSGGRSPTGDSGFNVRAALRLAMKVDVRMAPFRDDPAIVALLAEPVTRKP